MTAKREVATEDLVDEVIRRSNQELLSRVKPVINATGIVLHTNLGRAPLSDSARAAVLASAGYCDIEYDLISGGRGSRQDHVEPLLRLLLGAEAGFMVCNNAAAILLTLRVLAARKEVVVARGQAVEIGDGFRMPQIVKQSGARLTEVGTTNRTSLDDYAEAIGPKTGAILWVHTSNFAIVGFTEQPDLRSLAQLAHRQDIPLVVDNGSGSLLDTTRFGLDHEPMPAEAIAAGADIVTFSTDKLLGGPQGGIIAGSREMVTRIRRHSLARTMRSDKTAVASLKATLSHYAEGNPEAVPVVRMIAALPEDLKARGTLIVAKLLEAGLPAAVTSGESAVGGGSLPGQTLPTTLVAVDPPSSADSFNKRLRALNIPIIARTQRNRVLLDVRTVDASEEDSLIEGLVTAARRS